MLYIAAMATAITACSGDDSPLVSEANTPITVSATIPGEVWAVASRLAIESYSDLQLHYTDYKGKAGTFAVPTENISATVNNISFTTGSKLVWEQVDATKPMHLTCVCNNGTDATTDDYTLHTSVASATVGQPLAFSSAMTPTAAMLTLKLTLEHNMTGALSDMTATVSAEEGVDTYDPMTHGGLWPATGNKVNKEITLPAPASGNVYNASIILPQQTMGNTLTIKYGTTATWTLDLSQVSVSGGKSEQKANQLIVGQHLTLNLTASLIGLNTPSDIKIEAFTAAADGSYEDELGGSAKKSNP